MTGDDLKTYRESKGWTQIEAAEKFGYSRTGWQRAERLGPNKRLIIAIQEREAKS